MTIFSIGNHIWKGKKMSFSFVNHWYCWKDWIELKVFSLIFDYKETKYKYLEITILNFEFVWWFGGNNE